MQLTRPPGTAPAAAGPQSIGTVPAAPGLSPRPPYALLEQMVQDARKEGLGIFKVSFKRCWRWSWVLPPQSCLGCLCGAQVLSSSLHLEHSALPAVPWPGGPKRRRARPTRGRPAGCPGGQLP